MTPNQVARRIVCSVRGEMPPGAGNHLFTSIVQALHEAVAAEREACAKIADANTFHGLGADVGMGIAAAIRARSQP